MGLVPRVIWIFFPVGLRFLTPQQGSRGRVFSPFEALRPFYTPRSVEPLYLSPSELLLLPSMLLASLTGMEWGGSGRVGVWVYGGCLDG